MGAQILTLRGRRYALLPESEYRRLSAQARAAAEGPWPALPKADARGEFPAVEYARASLARKVVRRRRAAGLTQADLARRAGIRPETLNRIERAKTTPDVATLAKIDRALDAAEAQAAAEIRIGFRRRVAPNPRTQPLTGRGLREQPEREGGAPMYARDAYAQFLEKLLPWLANHVTDNPTLRDMVAGAQIKGYPHFVTFPGPGRRRGYLAFAQNIISGDPKSKVLAVELGVGPRLSKDGLLHLAKTLLSGAEVDTYQNKARDIVFAQTQWGYGEDYEPLNRPPVRERLRLFAMDALRFLQQAFAREAMQIEDGNAGL